MNSDIGSYSYLTFNDKCTFKHIAYVAYIARFYLKTHLSIKMKYEYGLSTFIT